jgi:hypothetical protein
VASGSTVRFVASMRNPQFETVDATVTPIVPAGWEIPPPMTKRLRAGEETTFEFDVVVGEPVIRARVAVDVTAGHHLLGQAAEAIVTVK